MKIVALCSTKGGGGRSTLAIHLAVAGFRRGYSTTLIDLDPSTSASQWADFRENPQPNVLSIPAQRLNRALGRAREDGCDFAILDGAPNAPEAMIEACEASDLILVPSRPNIVDIRVNRTTAKIAKMSGKAAYVVINQARPGSTLLVAEAQEALRSAGFAIAPVPIHARAVFAHCMIVGKTAEEYEPNSKGAAEIEALFKWVKKTLNLLSPSRLARERVHEMELRS